MGRPKRQFPLGKYRLGKISLSKSDSIDNPDLSDKKKDDSCLRPIELEYIWNRKAIRRTTNIFVRASDWNQNGNRKCGEVRPSYGEGYKDVNTLLMKRLQKVNLKMAEYCMLYGGSISESTVRDILQDKPITRKDEGKDFVEFARNRLDSEYSRYRIGLSRYKNCICSLNIFSSYLEENHLGTYSTGRIYIGDMTPELLESYLCYRRHVRHNSDETINHALTPILVACNYAKDLGYLDADINRRIQDLRILKKPSFNEEDNNMDEKSLTKDQLLELVNLYGRLGDKKQKTSLEIFLFAFHACGLRVVDVISLQWKHIDFEKRELRKVMVKTKKRHTIPLSDQATAILQKWRSYDENHLSEGNTESGDENRFFHKCGSKYVFGLVEDSFNIEDEKTLYAARNNITKQLNHILKTIGESIGLPFTLTMHVARHTFAMYALNKGLSLSVVSRLLGHTSTNITEKVYARYLPETLATEMKKLEDGLTEFRI